MRNPSYNVARLCYRVWQAKASYMPRVLSLICFFGIKDKNKIEFDMWERQVLAVATDHSDNAIRQAMLQSLKGQALMVTTTLPPNTHWKELL